MELEIFKEKLNQCLNIVEPLTKKNLNLPILSNVLIEAEKNFLKISATNLETSIIWWILSNIKKEGKVLIPASFFRSLMGFIKEDKIFISSDENSLTLKNNDQINQIQGLNPDDFPIIPKMLEEEFVEIDGSTLNQGLLQVVNIPSFSQIRPEISGIYFSFKKDILKVVSTDSFRLAEKTIKLNQKNKKDISFIIPQSTARELISILSVKSDKLRFYFNPNQILFEWIDEETPYPQIHFSSRLIEGDYPSYQEIIPKKYTSQIIINKEDFLNQIKKAGLFSGKVSEIKISIISKENKIRIFSQSADIGKNESFLPVKIKEKGGELEEVSFNYKFLIDGLNNIKSSEVIFSLSEKEGPATLAPVGDESYVYVLMPIKSLQ